MTTEPSESLELSALALLGIVPPSGEDGTVSDETLAGSPEHRLAKAHAAPWLAAWLSSRDWRFLGAIAGAGEGSGNGNGQGGGEGVQARAASVRFAELPPQAREAAAYGFAARLALPLTGSRSLCDYLAKSFAEKSADLERRDRLSEHPRPLSLAPGSLLAAFHGGAGSGSEAAEGEGPEDGADGQGEGAA